MSVLMFVVGAATLLSALGVVFSHKPIHSALWLIFTLLTVAGHFALLGAEFLAVLQILVYAGAIMVLVVFVIMLLGSAAESREERAEVLKLCSALVVGSLLGLFALGAERSWVASAGGDGANVVGGVSAFGREMFVDYLLVFNLSGVLLMAAVIGAVFIAHESRRPLPKGRGLRAMRLEDETKQAEAMGPAAE